MKKEKKSVIEILRQKAEELLNHSNPLSIPLKSTSPLSENETQKLIHELEVQQIELEMQNDELQCAIADVEIIASKYTDLYDFAPSGYVTLSKLGEVKKLNIACAKMCGIERVNSINSRFGFFVSADTLLVFNLFLNKVFQSKSQETCEVTLSKDGDLPTYVLLTGIISKNEELCNVTMVDITARKLAELEKAKRAAELVITNNEIAVQRERFSTVIDNIVDGVITISDCGLIESFNPGARKLFGYREEEVIGQNVKVLMPEPYHSEHDGYIEHHITTAEKKIIGIGREVEGRHKDGNVFPMELEVNEVSIDNVRRFVGITHDITERKQAEEEKRLLEQQLQHSQKQESLGQLSGGIAHNFNNILGIIIGYCGLTKMNIQTAEKNIPIIEKAAERAAVLCRQMMAYSGKEKLTKTKINMAIQVNDTIVMLKSSLSQNAVIKTELPANIPMIEGDASQLNQVVMNLIINASEAIGTEQGEVNVSLDKFDIIAGKTLEDYNGKPIPFGEYVCLEVTDNGCGMDETTLSRLFEPFFTTKFTGRGLGMSAVLGIIKSHGGVLQLFSQPSQGTTFKVFLPALLNELTGDENQSSSRASESWQGSGTILLVEDEEQFRFIAKELLKMFGFTVLEAVNGKEGLEMYQKNAADIMLVFTDIGMPVMDGYEMVEKLKKLKPELPIIISTGYGDADVKERIGSNNIAGIASKPYNVDKLRTVLKSVVEGI
jgi:PAS domain S-box-containing protein